MQELLHCWLASRHVLGIPGWGTLRVSNLEPEIDFVNKQINPPKQQVFFTDEVLPADKTFYQWLASVQTTDETTAIRRFNDFIAELKDNLQKTGTAVLPGIGVFRNTETDQPAFSQNESSSNQLLAIHAEKIMRHQESFNVLQGDMDNTSLEAVQHIDIFSEEKAQDNWWIAALILFAAGALAILFYYLS